MRDGVVDPRKYISEGLSHNLLKAVREDPALEKVILSEPLTLIPYALEGHPLRPDYNLPPDYLTIQGERCFINQVSQWLMKLKASQPTRHRLYYIGGRHHFLVLWFANVRAGTPFTVIYEIPAGGIKDYAPAAERFVQQIHDCEDRSILPRLRPVDDIITAFFKSRGRYTHRRFWKQIITLRKQATDFVQEVEHVCSEDDYHHVDYSKWYESGGVKG